MIYKEFDRKVRASGLSSLEWRVLSSLADRETLTIGELASIVLAKQPTLTKLIDRMALAGLVGKRDDPADRRKTLVSGTARGRRLITPLIEAAREHEQEVLRDFSVVDVRALKTILKSLVVRADALAAELAEAD